MILRQLKEPFRRIVVPDHKNVAKGTMRVIIKQVGLTVGEFKNLL
jgi:predicted RNA binding protein YcfA (HicA-like mRNA interferase family)